MNGLDIRGYKTITLKDEKEYKIEINFNTIIDLEIQLKSIAKVFEMIQKPTLENTRLLLWAALQEHNEGIQLREVGRLMDFDKIDSYIKELDELIQMAFPTKQTEGEQVEKVDELPR